MSMMEIPFYKPRFTALEKKYVCEALDEGWVSSKGRFVQEFENAFADFIGTKYAVSTNTGTAACHIALLASHKIDNGDGPMKVIVPDLTFIATANAVKYCGGQLVLSDVDQETWNLGYNMPDDIENVTHVFPVHLMGNPCDINCIYETYPEAVVVEDACEAHGSRLDGRMVGSLGDLACFSFFGNKIMTTGEGGMITTNNYDYYRKALLLRGQAQTKQYFHSEIGHNYRMTNIQAAIGLAQLQGFHKTLNMKRHIFEEYQQRLQNTPVIMQDSIVDASSNLWGVAIRIGERDKLQEYLRMRGIDTRIMFRPMHLMPPHHDGAITVYCNSQAISNDGLILPSYPELKLDTVVTICEYIKRFLAQ
jgi:perosamine synthetase